mmetsp:Transcript_25701/g.45162  ORF Transcript_25701/g.45162 Transcript_25701/m.45162 type:complete len:90 (+) Transcript_25701:269-538(+)
MVTQPDVKALPFRTRRVCTDVLMLVVFLASLGGLCWLCRYALLEGDMKKILHGQDYMSDVCGQDNSVAATQRPKIVNASYGGPAFWNYV